jgi:hypothetical protein
MPFDRRLGGLQSRSRRRGEKKILDPTGTRTQILSRPARCHSLYRLRYSGSLRRSNVKYNNHSNINVIIAVCLYSKSCDIPHPRDQSVPGKNQFRDIRTLFLTCVLVKKKGKRSYPSTRPWRPTGLCVRRRGSHIF